MIEATGFRVLRAENSVRFISSVDYLGKPGLKRAHMAIDAARAVGGSNRLNHDQRRNTSIVSRFLQVEETYHCAVFKPPAGFPEPALHQCRNEPVRAHLS